VLGAGVLKGHFTGHCAFRFGEGIAISFDMPIHTFYTLRTFTEKGPHVKQILSLTGRFLYFLMGWEFEELPSYFSSKHVIIGFPHTCNMDAVRAFIGYRIIKRTGHIMVKKEWFLWPRSPGGAGLRLTYLFWNRMY